MKFGDFLLQQSRTPDSDFVAIDDALREARLCEELGFDVAWLAEHHFDGACAYVDPAAFAAAVAVQTSRISIGFAVAQLAFHHPVRLAEQIALLDNISRGRIIVGIGRGPRFKLYEYRGYGISADEAQGRLLEAEEVLLGIFTATDYKHQGKYWQVELPVLRPQPYQKPHPPIVRACSSLDSVLAMARQGRPCLMTIQRNETIRQWVEQYRRTMAETGYDDASIARNMENCWVLRNVFVAETDAEAEAIGVPAYQDSLEHSHRVQNQLTTDAEEAYVAASGALANKPPPFNLVYGSPATVCEDLEELHRVGVGGLIMRFRIGALPWDVTENSLRLFAQKVAPEFRMPVAG